MQERWFIRPKWVNPFRTRSEGRIPKPWFEGFLRAAPFHRWNLTHISHILELVAKEPCLFGFPNRPTCVVNTSHMLPSARSRQSGITVFGTERGCKTVVIPPSCSKHPFDATDAKLIEPLFKWNPSMELLYLSKSCEAIAPLIAAWLKPLRNLHTVVMVDWEDAGNINKIVMAAKYCEVIDCLSPDEVYKNWNNAVAIESMCEMIEMHTKLRSIVGSPDFLGAVHHAVEFSRCKHNVALVGKWCRFSRIFRGMWVTGIVGFAILLGYWSREAFIASGVRPERKDAARDLTLAGVIAVLTLTVLVLDHFRFRHTGRGWTYWTRYLVLLRRRLGKSGLTQPVLHDSRGKL